MTCHRPKGTWIAAAAAAIVVAADADGCDAVAQQSGLRPSGLSSQYRIHRRQSSACVAETAIFNLIN